ncbi:hemerythrin domain-containing protein [Brevundimonas sp.]|uniref:hemerythrin domain-containing protein n=1 Tax=Brevundimonas sp. TaxID=1871086 RepID=UPI0019ACDCFC|nr:hemerythrin domain-containing protein [Brevundimonas sp.]MBD3836998.1 hemerythrin domain-containing protein [Brevundimonas sp.]
MSVIDKALAAVTPQPNEEKRAAATKKARAAASPGDWLSLALDHHDQIRAAFAEGRKVRSAADRRAAMERLALVLNGHSLAEEIVLYPAMAQHGHKMQAGVAYSEQTTAKMQMAELENIAPSSDAWLDKWGHIEGAVLTHMFEEENGWFIDLKDKGDRQDRLTARYSEEFERYTGAR